MQNLRNVNLVIVSGSEKVQKLLREMFIKRGANVVLSGFLNQDLISQIEHNETADVILIDMNDAYEEDESTLECLLDKVDLPILFYENLFNEINESSSEYGFSLQEINKLATKLADLANSSKNSHPEKTDVQISELQTEETINSALAHDSDKQVVTKNTIEHSLLKSTKPPEKAVNVWVLGASIGGPEAVKRFLTRIPPELPVAFVLAQHLGDGFVGLLANQLDKISHFKVREGVDGDTLRHGEVIIVPVDNRVVLDMQGQIKFLDENWQGHYKPSIDSVIDKITNYYQKQSGVIIFSGMGADGVLACQKFSEKYEGKVWAQSADTCVISSMPDSVCKANLVSYSGSPEALALKIAVYYMGKDSYIA
ncbi:MAG: chemotaxis protein CheB [gamma proteobacterium symbiont of Bathyaustriella thionipta]|nr:chemotaxis protein CheB [gamma proteobacterium symbiont of Bathyaustriella thionipta]MCU7951475.1 chemotaxis protein CheB [gamma proteobacterium symbiont of Bathyaustriella thionipta]MCU7953425.1 chemotaxis protein CheB [gamma proteobacterium symbiont of Bathyaustriella thionipta]MCU7958045.1 chemotaxis protein CheB [gamma proteobacterium symbiont of Bathyaustriella thionipta]MCU7968920.1 chemotaxis protein CheB [gamma proteobacterium symbiont of Bathyaustriella thionipta]